jgi:hypothetical protein
VLVQQVTNYKRAYNGMPLQAGQVLILGKESKATVTFGDCHVLLSDTTLYRVPEEAPCRREQALLLHDDMIIRPASGEAEQFVKLRGVEEPLQPAALAVLKPTVIPANSLAPAIIGTGTFATAAAFSLYNTLLVNADEPLSSP